MGTEYLV